MSFLLPSHQSRKVVTSSINKKKDTTTTTKIKQCLCIITGLAIGILIWLFYQTIQVTKTTTKRITQVSGSFRDNLLAVKSNGADLIWEQLLKEASDYLQSSNALSSDNQQIGVAMEVGMHRAVQCIMAANAGLEVHCVEPSPKSFERVKSEVQHDVLSDNIRSNIHLYQRAASDKSGIKVPFSGSGGTGDFVGDGGYDIWTMTKKESTNKGTIGLHQVAIETVEVETIALDDIIESTQKQVYLLKVDVQGFEPNVMRGLSRSIQNHRIKFLLFEYWPKGIEFMHDEPLGSCTLPTQMLYALVEHGYTLYATNVVAHPKCPKGSRMGRMWKQKRPLDNIMNNCLWYHQHELEFLSEDYKMGYWTDVLAVAPNAKLPNMIQPTTLIGQALKPDLI